MYFQLSSLVHLVVKVQQCVYTGVLLESALLNITSLSWREAHTMLPQKSPLAEET